MLPLLLLQLLLTLVPADCSSIGSAALHPSLSTAVQYGTVDAGDWHSSFATSIRGLDARLATYGSLRLFIDVENLPDRNNFQLDLALRCRPSAAEQQLQYILPFTFHGETLCPGVLPFTVSSARSTWLTTGRQPQQLKYSLILTLQRVRGAPDVDFSQTLSHSVRLKLALHNAKWRLESSSIYLWSWDSAFKLHGTATRPGSSYPRYFLTDAALELMLHQSLASSDPFGSVQFIDPALVQLTAKAPEYVQNYINIEAIMLLGVGVASECRTPRAQFSLVFGTRKAGVIEQHDKMLKVAQLDAASGKLTYSRYGLSSAMQRFYRESRKQVSSSHRPEDYRLRVCAGVELTHPQIPVSAFKTVELLLDPKLTYRALGSLHDDCQVVGSSSRRVTLFAGSGYNRLICPIICSNIEEPYLFYRGKIALTPNSRYDRTRYLNDSISAFKAGTVIDIRDDLTHEDAGEYSCTAGKQRVTFQVRVVSLPHFSTRLLSGQQLIGSLPARIYAVEGEGYRVSCTAHFTGIGSAALVMEFYLKVDSADGKFHWTKTSADAFIAEAKADESRRCEAEVAEKSSAHSKSWTLTVRGVRREGRPRLSFFDHRLACTASASAADSGRLGMADFSAQTGSDVLFVARPRTDSFGAAMTACCLAEAACGASAGGECSLDVFLKKPAVDHLASIGVTVGAVFELGGAPFSSASVSFSPATARATVKLGRRPLGQLAGADRDRLRALTPVFRYQMAGAAAAAAAASFTVLRGAESDAAGDRACADSPLCLFSTGFDRGLSRSLAFASVAVRLATAKGASVPSWLSAAAATPTASPDGAKAGGAKSGLAGGDGAPSWGSPEALAAAKANATPELLEALHQILESSGGDGASHRRGTAGVVLLWAAAAAAAAAVYEHR